MFLLESGKKIEKPHWRNSEVVHIQEIHCQQVVYFWPCIGLQMEKGDTLSLRYIYRLASADIRTSKVLPNLIFLNNENCMLAHPQE